MEDRHVWVIYYASLVGWTLHPGAGTKGHQVMSLAECAAMADRMLALTPRGV